MVAGLGRRGLARTRAAGSGGSLWAPDVGGQHNRPRPVTVVVDAGHIVAVGPTLPSSARRGAQLIAGRGRFLIPGLWDMHVHVVDAGEAALGEAVAAGVTGIRDLGGELPVLDAWRR